jgi:hypothetical protein
MVLDTREGVRCCRRSGHFSRLLDSRQCILGVSGFSSCLVGKAPLAAHVTCYRGPEGTCYRGPFDVLSRTFPQVKTMNGKGKLQPETLKLLYYVES